jgi:hypothetical protein
VPADQAIDYVKIVLSITKGLRGILKDLNALEPRQPRLLDAGAVLRGEVDDEDDHDEAPGDVTGHGSATVD